jgi:hypothetical protein
MSIKHWSVGATLWYFAFVFILLIGWVMNIVALTNAPAIVQWGAMEVLRVVGIFVAPLGGVLGWF